MLRRCFCGGDAAGERGCGIVGVVMLCCADGWWRVAVRLFCGLGRRGVVLFFEGPGEDEYAGQGDECDQDGAFQSEVSAGEEEIAFWLGLEQRGEGEAADFETEEGSLEEVPGQVEEKREPQVFCIDIVNSQQKAAEKKIGKGEGM